MKTKVIPTKSIGSGWETKPFADKPPLTEEQKLNKIKADAIREAFGELADEYRSGGLRLTYTGFAIAQHIEAQTKNYADKLEAGTL